MHINYSKLRIIVRATCVNPFHVKGKKDSRSLNTTKKIIKFKLLVAHSVSSFCELRTMALSDTLASRNILKENKNVKAKFASRHGISGYLVENTSRHRECTWLKNSWYPSISRPHQQCKHSSVLNLYIV